jgi:hypothetical protein
MPPPPPALIMGGSMINRGLIMKTPMINAEVVAGLRGAEVVAGLRGAGGPG